MTPTLSRLRIGPSYHDLGRYFYSYSMEFYHCMFIIRLSLYYQYYFYHYSLATLSIFVKPINDESRIMYKGSKIQVPADLTKSAPKNSNLSSFAKKFPLGVVVRKSLKIIRILTYKQ